MRKDPGRIDGHHHVVPPFYGHMLDRRGIRPVDIALDLVEQG